MYNSVLAVIRKLDTLALEAMMEETSLEVFVLEVQQVLEDTIYEPEPVQA